MHSKEGGDRIGLRKRRYSTANSGATEFHADWSTFLHDMSGRLSYPFSSLAGVDAAAARSARGAPVKDLATSGLEIRPGGEHAPQSSPGMCMNRVLTALKKRSGRIGFRIDNMLRTLTGSQAGRRIVFLHIPKCAGSSVNFIFKRTIGSSRSGRVILIDDRIDAPVYEDKVKRARVARFVGGHFGFETLNAVRGDALTFTVLRDPFDRLRSTYGHFHTRKKGNPLGHKVPHMTLEEYLKSEDPEILQWTDNVMARQLACSHDRERVVGLPLDAMIEQAIAHIDQIDVIAFLDQLPEDMARVTQEAGIRFDGLMPQENVTSRKSSGKAPTAAIAPLDDNQKRLALERIRGDLAVYDYARRKAGLTPLRRD